MQDTLSNPFTYELLSMSPWTFRHTCAIIALRAKAVRNLAHKCCFERGPNLPSDLNQPLDRKIVFPGSIDGKINRSPVWSRPKDDSNAIFRGVPGYPLPSPFLAPSNPITTTSLTEVTTNMPHIYTPRRQFTAPSPLHSCVLTSNGNFLSGPA